METSWSILTELRYFATSNRYAVGVVQTVFPQSSVTVEQHLLLFCVCVPTPIKC